MGEWKTKLLIFTLSLSALLGCSHSQAESEQTDTYMTDDEEYLQLIEPYKVTEILEEVFQYYDKAERPFYRIKPVEIGILLEVSAISHISEENMEFQATVYFTHTWFDPRLAFEKDNNDSFIILRKEQLKNLWLPDTFVANARTVSVETNTYSAVVYANGMIEYSYRMSITALSDMNFLQYPMDNQKLEIYIQSYTYTIDQLTLYWKKGSMVYNEMAGFVVKKVQKLEEHGYLVFRINVRRRLGYFIMQFYFPCILCAVVSWLPFWMDRYEIGDRMALSITTLLTEVFLSQYINSSMPRVSYIKAADEYLLATFIFIFMSLLENVVVYNNRSDVKTMKKKKKKSTKVEFELQDVHCYSREISSIDEMTETKKTNVEGEAPSTKADHDLIENDAEQKETPEKDRSLLVDKISRIFFPLSFLVFQAYYFGRYRPSSM